MPDRWTFRIKAIRELIDREMAHGGAWVDPFAGFNSPAQITNDLDPFTPAQSHRDALEFLRELPSSSHYGALYDPPYSYRQASECYTKAGRDLLRYTVTNDKYWGQVKNEIARILVGGGCAICCGWNSGGLGAKRGFTLRRVLLVAHGGHHNDTIITVEDKTQDIL